MYNRSAFANKRLIYFVVIVGLFAVATLYFIGRSLFGSQTASSLTTTPQVAVKGVKSNTALNREFEFPLNDKDGKKISSLKYIIESAELRDEILVQGKKATAVEDRTFLVLNIKLTNNLDRPVSINTKDYMRLSVNGNENEWLAPEIHNDPVTVQSISTKYTRIGFPINNSDTNLRLRVGEVAGEKSLVEVKF